MGWFKKEDGKINWWKVILVIFLPAVGIVALFVMASKTEQEEGEVVISTENEVIDHVADEPQCDLHELDGKKVWDLYKMDEGQYMLQTEDSEYYKYNTNNEEGAVVYNSVKEEEA